MQTKVCKKCGLTKPIDEFYAHPRTADKRLGMCKDCKRSYTKAHSKTAEKRAAEKIRNASEHRRTLRARGLVEWRRNNPEKVKAHNALWKAILSGKVIRATVCEECGSNQSIHAHHEDYSKPLDVQWLCAMCHGKRNPSATPF